MATDFLQRLCGKVSADPRTAVVLDGMLRELPPPLISSESQIPLRTVERLRARIRATATEIEGLTDSMPPSACVDMTQLGRSAAKKKGHDK